MRAPRTPLKEDITNIEATLGDTFISESSNVKTIETTLENVSVPLITGMFSSDLPRTSSSPSPVLRYKSCVTPNLLEQMDKLCFDFIAQGWSIYLNQDCTTAHRGSKLEVEPGDAFVLKHK